MTDLKGRLTAMIRASGPISVATYMDLCLHDRTHGYYATRPGLGQDFITAPETSQIFGELVGLWAAHEWQRMGSPTQFTLIEIGPGRGTLMADALRATQRTDGFHDAVNLSFIDPSPVLQNGLRTRFETRPITFLNGLDEIAPDRPFILIANEWLDCLPVQQYVRVGAAWHERVIGLDETGRLAFGLQAEALPVDLNPMDDQSSVEIQPGLKTLAETLQAVFSRSSGRALFIDYGPPETVPEDTLRAYQKGQQVAPLAAPGETDLTCDVDFGRFQRLLASQSLAIDGPVSQSQFLLSLGAEARLNQLAKAHPEQADTLHQSVLKLVDPAQMGARFQVLSVRSPDDPVSAGFSALRK